MTRKCGGIIEIIRRLSIWEINSPPLRDERAKGPVLFLALPPFVCAQGVLAVDPAGTPTTGIVFVASQVGRTLIR